MPSLIPQTTSPTSASPLHSPRNRTSFNLPRHPRRRSSTMTTGTNFSSAFDGEEVSPGGSMYEEGGEEWEGGDEGEEYVKRYRRGGKKDEPMSPLAVVFMFYLIWQLLTRSTESEILAHVAPSSSLAQHLSEAELGALGIRNSPSLGGYNLPYHFPHIPSPIPPSSSSTSSGNGGNVSFWRLAFGVIMYPLYLVVTLLAIPFPLLLNVGHVLLSIALTVLYPFTLTAKVATKVFLLTPLSWAGSVFKAVSPILGFIAGVLGFGCIMGLAVGWAGRRGLDWLLGRRKGSIPSKGSKRSMKRSSRSRRSQRQGWDRSTWSRDEGNRHTTAPLGSIREEDAHIHLDPVHIDHRRSQTSAPAIEIDTRIHSQRRRRSPSSSADSIPPNPRTPRHDATQLYAEIAEGEHREISPSRRFRAGSDKRMTRDEDGAVLGTRRRGVFAASQAHEY